jgi:hypothetical protein
MLYNLPLDFKLSTNFKKQKMKKTIFFTFLVIFSLSAFALKPDSKSKSENPAIPDKTENKMSEEEMARLTKRVEEIRDMDKKDLTLKEKRALKNELKEIKENVKSNGGYVYIGAGALIIIVILLIILLV